MTSHLSVTLAYTDSFPASIAIGTQVLGGTVVEIGAVITASQRLVAGLSQRERQVMEGIAAGHCVSRIATELGISRKTVNSYRYRIHEQLEVGNDVQAVLLFINSK